MSWLARLREGSLRTPIELARARKVDPLAMLLGEPAARVRRAEDPASVLPLYRFAAEDDVAGFTITTDQLFGGKSVATFRLKRYTHFAAALFEGRVEFHSNEATARGGFCNARTSARRLIDAGESEAVQVRIKTDGRPYLLNFHCRDMSDEDVYQAEVRTDPYRWETLALPWEQLALVTRGAVRDEQVPIDPSKIHGFGVTIADGRNGPFRCELQHVLAVREWDPTGFAPAGRAISAIVTEAQVHEQQGSATSSTSTSPSSDPVGSYRPTTGDASQPRIARTDQPYAPSDDELRIWNEVRSRAGLPNDPRRR